MNIFGGATGGKANGNTPLLGEVSATRIENERLQEQVTKLGLRILRLRKDNKRLVDENQMLRLKCGLPLRGSDENDAKNKRSSSSLQGDFKSCSHRSSRSASSSSASSNSCTHSSTSTTSLDNQKQSPIHRLNLNGGTYDDVDGYQLGAGKDHGSHRGGGDRGWAMLHVHLYRGPS